MPYYLRTEPVGHRCLSDSSYLSSSKGVSSHHLFSMKSFAMQQIIFPRGKQSSLLTQESKKWNCTYNLIFLCVRSGGILRIEQRALNMPWICLEYAVAGLPLCSHWDTYFSILFLFWVKVPVCSQACSWTHSGAQTGHAVAIFHLPLPKPLKL